MKSKKALEHRLLVLSLIKGDCKLTCIKNTLIGRNGLLSLGLADSSSISSPRGILMQPHGSSKSKTRIS